MKAQQQLADPIFLSVTADRLQLNSRDCQLIADCGLL
jgi:hypothetical protein